MTTKTKTPDLAADRMATQHAARMGHADPLLTPAKMATEVAEAVAAVGGVMSPENVRGLITAECRAVEAMLLSKNEKYGNSALEPRRAFSKASPVEQILVRIDDKISRLTTIGIDANPDDEDTVADLIGYLLLLRVARRLGLR